MQRFRIRSLQIGFVVAVAAVLVRIGYVQTADAFLYHRAKLQWDASDVIQPVRGTIYDSTGGILAYSVPAYTIDLNLQAIRQADKLSAVAGGLASIVHVRQATMLSALNRPGVTWLQLYPYLIHVSLFTKQKVEALFTHLNLSNDLTIYKAYLREYPNQTLASHVIGFTNEHGQGSTGVELSYNKYLAGTPGYRQFTQDTFGNPIPFYPEHEKPVQNGDNVYLTINPVIQRYAQKALSTIQQRFTPKRAAIIVANPKTGAILAMATLPTFNPNEYWKYSASTLYTNWAISDPFEPGSTFKPEVFVGALTTHSITMNQTYMSGVDYVNGVPIHDWNIYGWGRLTYEQALIYSSNVGLIHIGQAEGVKNFYNYWRLFGFNHRTGIDLPGEGHSIIFPEKNLNAVDFATMAFGQGLAVTPIQQVAAIGAIANGGDLITPYVVQKVVAPSGKDVFQHHVHVVRNVAPRSIMTEVTNAMVKVVNEDPQGNVGVIPGYNIAGKTGTAQIPKPGGGYYANVYNLSFIGFVPAHHPKVEIYVTVNEPLHTAQWGDWVATPAARYVLERTLKYLEIPPHQTTTQKTHTQTQAATHATQYVSVPNVTGIPSNQSSQHLHDAGLQDTVIGGQGTVIDQWPHVGTRVPEGSTVAIEIQRHNVSSVTVPNFKGMLMTEAMHVCSSLGLRLNPSGFGFATTQSIPAGHSVPIGTRIQVDFSSSTI